MEKIINDGDRIQPDLAGTADKTTDARPLTVLADLIKKDIAAGEKAGLEHYKAAGEKLIEAKAQLDPGRFGGWIADTLKISRTTAYRYMKMADANVSHGKQYKSQRQFRKEVLKEKPWPKPDIDVEAFKKPVLGEKDESELKRKLALKLIDIGYRGLVKELHPDSGGDDRAMQRLNTVREQLKACADKFKTGG